MRHRRRAFTGRGAVAGFLLLLLLVLCSGCVLLWRGSVGGRRNEGWATANARALTDTLLLGLRLRHSASRSSFDESDLGPDPTLPLYEAQVTYPSDCGFRHQPTAVQDFTDVLQSHPDIAHRCIYNPSIATIRITPRARDTSVHPPPARSGSRRGSGAAPDLDPDADPDPDLEDLVLVTFRIYTSKKGVPCMAADRPGGPWDEGWSGTGGLGMAVLRWSDLASGRQPRVLYQWHEIPSTREDARLFRDNLGKIRLSYNRWRGGDPMMRGFKRFQRRSMHVSEVAVEMKEDGGVEEIRLQNEQELIYIYQDRDEKNWVPWEGSTYMTYPQFPGFQPHIVIDWTSYELALDQLSFKSFAPVEFMERFRNVSGGWIRFSGGTPGIQLAKDSYMAVGHIVGDLTCFHEQLPPHDQQPWRPPNATEAVLAAAEEQRRADAAAAAAAVAQEFGGGRAAAAGGRGMWQPPPPQEASDRPPDGAGGSHAGQGAGAAAALAAPRRRARALFAPAPAASTSDGGGGGGGGAGVSRLPRPRLSPHPCNASFPAPTQHHLWQKHFWNLNHTLPRHHPFWEYFCFLYVWSARPPHEITHMSPAFIPYDKGDHRGVIFPTGIERVPAHVAARLAQQQQQQQSEAAGSETRSRGAAERLSGRRVHAAAVEAGEGAGTGSGDGGGGEGERGGGGKLEVTSSFLLTLGKDDGKMLSMVLGPELVSEWLQPVGQLQPEEYRFCTVGGPGPPGGGSGTGSEPGGKVAGDGQQQR